MKESELKRMFPNTVDVNWDHWLKMPTIKLWQAVALSMYVAPENFRAINNQFDAWLEEEVEKPDVQRDIFRSRLELLKAHVFDTDNLNVASINANNSNSRVYLNDFVDWTLKVKWDIPKELETLVATKEKVEDKLYREDKPNVEPWKVHQEGDPKPKYPWYTAAPVSYTHLTLPTTPYV